MVKTKAKKPFVLLKDIFTFFGCLILSTILVTLAMILIEFIQGVPDYKLEELHKGMTKGDVVTTIGKPAHKFDTVDGVETNGGYWVYSRPLSLSWVEVRFDGNNRFAWFEFDSL